MKNRVEEYCFFFFALFFWDQHFHINKACLLWGGADCTLPIRNQMIFFCCWCPTFNSVLLRHCFYMVGRLVCLEGKRCHLVAMSFPGIRKEEKIGIPGSNYRQCSDWCHIQKYGRDDTWSPALHCGWKVTTKNLRGLTTMWGGGDQWECGSSYQIHDYESLTFSFSHLYFSYFIIILLSRCSAGLFQPQAQEGFEPAWNSWTKSPYECVVGLVGFL